MSVSSLSDSGSNSSKAILKSIISKIGTNESLFYAKHNHRTGNVHDQNDDECTRNQPSSSKSYKLTSKKMDTNKELWLIISSLDRYRFGRRSSIIESMLGFGVVPFHDNVECLMVDNIIDSSIKIEYPHIKEGDWFKSIDNIEVRTENIDNLLAQYTKATKVKLIFKGSAVRDERQEKNLTHEISNFPDFVATYKQIFQNDNKVKEHKEPVFLALIINREYYKSDNTDAIFYYPYVPNNFLFKGKGSFLTLDSITSNDLGSLLTHSTITVNSIKYYITYSYSNSTLIICAFSSSFQSIQTATCISKDLVSFLNFNISEIHSMQNRQYLAHVCDVLTISITNKTGNFFQNNPSPCIALPKEAQLRIRDALSEFESMDHKKWNESKKRSRDLTVCGTALYFNEYLLISNLPVNLRIIIESFLRVQGINDYIQLKNGKEMYIWETIKQLDNKNKHYLAICIRNHLMLVTVLKNPLLTNANLSYIPYMEEIIDTVNHLIVSGIESISQFWVDSGKRPSMDINTTTSQPNHKLKHNLQKGISTENIQETSSQKQTHNQEEYRKTCESESTLDWQGFGNKNEFKEQTQGSQHIEPLLNEVKSIMPMNWTAGWSNELKYFVHLNYSDATVTQPFKTSCPDFQLDIIKEHIADIHKTLYKTASIKKKSTDSTVPRSKNDILKEQCISVNVCSPSGDKETITIIGRLFTSPLREIYACFEQNVSQNLVELSFRMSLLNIG